MSAESPRPAATSGSRPPFLAFVSDSESVAALKQFAESKGWPAASVQQGDMAAAAAYLQQQRCPERLLVEITSAAAAPGELDQLADVCEPGVKVIVTGNVNEYSFYCWLTDIGISAYALKPLTPAILEAALQRTMDTPKPVAAAEKQPAPVIAVMGTRGGVGATTIALHMAALLAETQQKKTALLDLDPQCGTAALALDIEPCRGLRDALEKPERVDGLFMQRVMIKVSDTLSVLSAEESLDEPIRCHEQSAGILLEHARKMFDIVIVDLPATLDPFLRQVLALSDHVVLVTELTLAGLRDTLRMHDMCRDSLRRKPPVLVANRVGMLAKKEMPAADFEKGVNAKIAHRIPYVAEAYMATANGEGAVLVHKKTPALGPLTALMEQFSPPPEGAADAKIGKPRLRFLPKKKG